MITKWLYLLAGDFFLLMVWGQDNSTFTGPVIVPSQKEFILKKGQNYTILCKGSNPVRFEQQEIHELKYGSNFNFTQNQIMSKDSKYEYVTQLNLYNVDEFAIGYYACYDESMVNPDDILTDIVEEPINTDVISYFYIYVNGTGKMLAPMREVMRGTGNNNVAIQCRPTTPDVKVTLHYTDFPELEIFQTKPYNPKIGFVLEFEGLYEIINEMTCSSENGDDPRTIFVYKLQDGDPPKPTAHYFPAYFTLGETIVINCTAESSESGPFDIKWSLPNPKANYHEETNINKKSNGVIFKSREIINASDKDNGSYVCSTTHGTKSKTYSFSLELKDPDYLKLDFVGTGSPVIRDVGKTFNFNIVIRTVRPLPMLYYQHNGKNITIDGKKYKETLIKDTNFRLTLTVKNVIFEDSGMYSIFAVNAYTQKKITQKLDVNGDLKLDFKESSTIYYKGSEANFYCSIYANPLEKITWKINNETVLPSKYTVRDETPYKRSSHLKIPVHMSGSITCIAGSENKTKDIIVYEVPNGFAIQEKIDYSFWIPEGQDAILTCVASIYNFTNATWLDGKNTLISNNVKYSTGQLSHNAVLKLSRVSVEQRDNYTCVGLGRNNNYSKTDIIFLDVAEKQSLRILYPEEDKKVEVGEFQQHVKIYCQVEGVPPPEVKWIKNGQLLSNTTNTTITTRKHKNTVNTTIDFVQIREEDKGDYECVFNTSSGEYVRRTFTLEYKDTSVLKPTHLGIIGGIMIALLLLVLYLAIKIRKEKRYRKELAKIGLLYFKEGRKLNPNHGLDEQAEFLPYNDRFEFPRDKLFIGEMLGSGAFGEVFKAKAQGIINAECTDIVAVKMVKKTADNMCIKALASELKIMAHIGKHVNIVNLLGACTKNIGKRELIVIVEFCEFGNLHDYVRRHREVFIDQLTGNKEKCGKVNKGYSCSSNNSNGMQSDYFVGTNQTQETEHTFINSTNSNRSSRLADDKPKEVKEVTKASITSSMIDSRKDYMEYSDGRMPRPLTSRDLLAWSFQIARGMEYLASKKVLHGDLAARNLLLAKDNVVKICDFGLARTVYKDEEYQKKENSLLPVRWLAIECMTDRIFSTQSDVWAFGIVLWELFSLAKTPYPGISPADLLEWLQKGNRLSKPEYADDRIYEVMRKCWQHRPPERPSFTVLQEILGSFLEDNVRNHYIDLNSAYMNENLEQDGENYIAMVAGVDYSNMVIPSPKQQYVNVDNQFFPPTPTIEDEEGYLQMTPRGAGFTPREHNKFNFDPRRSNPAETPSNELTPMLTLHNLPMRSCSESDQESSISPYPKMCPRIEEEDADDVFEIKHNFKNASDTAVTNPTYITFTAEIEKPGLEKKELSNNYVNVPNGLVK